MLSDLDLEKLLFKLEIQTRRKISGQLNGDYKTKTKGSGFEFHQLTDYQYGDDVRFIDWKSSVRSDKLLVRQYLEDRNRTVHLIADISASANLKDNLIKKLTAILAFAALYTKDAVSLTLFTDNIELSFKAQNSKNAIINSLKNFFKYQPQSKKTDFTIVGNYIASLKPKNSLVCLISDFESYIPERQFKLLAKQKEIIAFKCSDQEEQTEKLYKTGLLDFQDSESGQIITVDTDNLKNSSDENNLKQKAFFKAAGIDLFQAHTNKPFELELVKFMQKRSIK